MLRRCPGAGPEGPSTFSGLSYLKGRLQGTDGNASPGGNAPGRASTCQFADAVRNVPGCSEIRYICVSCGGGEELYLRGEGVRCVVRHQLQEQLGEYRHEPAAVRIIDALVNSRRPRSVMQWMSNPRGGYQTLRFMLATGSLARLTLFSHASHSKVVSPQNAGGCRWWVPRYAR